MSLRETHREKFWDSHQKDEYECPSCDKGIDEVRLFEVHHKDGDVTNGDDENLVALCRECHLEEHSQFSDRYRNGYCDKFAGVF